MQSQNKLQQSTSTSMRFFKNSKNFIKQCKKTNTEEFKQLLRVHLTGLFFLGMFGFLVKLVHIPINNIIAGSAPTQ